MPSVAKRELYLAKSLEELRKKAEIKNFGKKNIERILDFSDKFYHEASVSVSKGDNERAYFFFHRFMTLLTYLKDEDKKNFMTHCRKKANDAMEQLTRLDKELSERYLEKQKSYEDRKATFFPTGNSNFPVPGTSVKIENNDDEYDCIDSKQLVERIQTSSEISKVLIIDIRSAENFAHSSIAANKLFPIGEVNIINIPHDIILSGLTYPQLRNKISLGVSLDCLERRRSMNHIIIIDEKTTEFQKGCSSYILADALFKWDASADKIKTKPLMLKGGYYDFIITFPTYTTNSKLVNNYFQPTASIKKSDLKSYDFFNEDQLPSDKNNKLLNGQSEKTINNNYNSIPINHSKNENDFKNNVNNNEKNKTIKIPGMARPIIPDRSSKPIFQNSAGNNLKNEDLDANIDGMDKLIKNSLIVTNKFSDTRNFPPKPAHLINKLNNNNINDNESIHDYGDKDNEDYDEYSVGKMDEDLDERNDRKYQTRTKFNSDQEVFSMDEEMSDYEPINNTNSDINSSNESVNHCSSTPLQINNGTNKHHHNNQPFSSSLSRWLSSPNIAQLEPNSNSDDSSSTLINNSPKMSPPMPLVDRTVKPLPYLNNLRKIREFSPQFSSCARITGLKNLGNTCFMNSVLQCLKNTKDFYEYLVSGNVQINIHSKFGSNGELTVELMELFKQMHHTSTYKHISPKDFKYAVSRHIPDFVDYKQQDAHEFLVRLLDRIHADLNKNSQNVDIFDPVTKDPNYYDKLSKEEAVNRFWVLHMKRNSSIISDLFEGLIISTLTCLHCKKSSKALEAFTCLTLPIPENTSRTTLKNCISLFLKGELITNEADWQCQECKQKRNAEKCTFIWKLPKILIIHLKRFTYDGMWRQKINAFIDFPTENLHIEARDGEENRTYNLYGVVNHFGSLEGGHYVAYSRNRELGIDWNRYDDQDVSSMSACDVVTQNAYVLFYKSA